MKLSDTELLPFISYSDAHLSTYFFLENAHTYFRLWKQIQIQAKQLHIMTIVTLLRLIE